jgi:hypothetical protein
MNPKYGLRNMSKIALSKFRSFSDKAIKYIRIVRSKFKKKSLYEIWKKRTDTVEVHCVLRSGIEEEALGVIQISLDAPCDVLREYIRRNFRTTLNKTIGDSFVFIYNLDTGLEAKLPRIQEPRKFSKKVAPYVIDPKTVLGRNVVTITPAVNAKPEPIPEFEKEETPINEFPEFLV